MANLNQCCSPGNNNFSLQSFGPHNQKHLVQAHPCSKWILCQGKRKENKPYIFYFCVCFWHIVVLIWLCRKMTWVYSFADHTLSSFQCGGFPTVTLKNVHLSLLSFTVCLHSGLSPLQSKTIHSVGSLPGSSWLCDQTESGVMHRGAGGLLLQSTSHAPGFPSRHWLATPNVFWTTSLDLSPVC